MSVEKHPIKFCISNVVNHKLADALNELKESGCNIEIESCLTLCGTCRYTPVYIIQDQWEYVNGPADLIKRFKKSEEVK